MAKREDTLIEQIERDALDDNVPVATALRKCVVLGGRSGSEKLRDWATRELKGYDGVDQDDLPEYRIAAAPSMLCAVKINAQITGQQIAPSVLPEGIRGHFKEEVPLRDGVGQIEALLKQPQIKLSPPMASEVRLMNHEAGDPSQQIVSIYWSVAHAAIEGVVDQIRTALVRLVAELRANMSDADELPSAEAANQAVSFVVTGKRPRINVATAQGTGSGATATANGQRPPEESGFWTRSRKIGAFVVGTVTVIAGIVAIAQAFQPQTRKATPRPLKRAPPSTTPLPTLTSPHFHLFFCRHSAHDACIERFTNRKACETPLYGDREPLVGVCGVCTEHGETPPCAVWWVTLTPRYRSPEKKRSATGGTRKKPRQNPIFDFWRGFARRILPSMAADPSGAWPRPGEAFGALLLVAEAVAKQQQSRLLTSLPLRRNWEQVIWQPIRRLTDVVVRAFGSLPSLHFRY